uniref:Solute carrier family 47 member 4 n=1 Tax=Lates calcarifer TaxID=8187 RepID=A0A4W6BQG7_LATCA
YFPSNLNVNSFHPSLSFSSCFYINFRCLTCRTRYYINVFLSPPAGWSVESLQEWGSYMKLAIPSTLMTCFEWWVYEFGGFFAGNPMKMSWQLNIAVIMVAFITYMFPLGIQAAACARVGNALGAGDTARAILTSKMSLALAGSFAVVEGIVLGSTKTVIGFIFTSDEKIIGLVSHLMNAYCFLQLFDGLVCVCTGIFLGTGKQKIPAVANLIGYYCIGLSLSVTLMFVAKLRVLGILFLETFETAYETQSGHVVQQMKEGRLSTTQLILRRGLTMFAAVGLLAVGASVHFLVPLPETPPSEANHTMDWINTTYTPDQIFTTVLVPIEESA